MPKFCVDCKWFSPTVTGDVKYHMCENPKVGSPNLVTGKIEPAYKRCFDLRYPSIGDMFFQRKICGWGGDWFAPKDKQ